METLRTCSKCREQKPETTEFFNRNKANPSGLHNQCKVCRGAYDKERIKRGFHNNRKAQKRWADKLREDVIGHYSHGKFCCACCGEDHREFLALDHINGDGEASQGISSRQKDACYVA